MRLAGPGGVAVSVVVPLYRSADTVTELYDRLRAALRDESFEIVFVDDCCPQASIDPVRRLAASDPRVSGLRLAHNVGQHRAVLAGLAEARGEWTVILDADLQDPPEAIPGLLVAAREGVGVVFAGRTGHYEARGRLVSSRLFKRLLHWLVGVPPDAGIYMVLHRRVVDALLALESPFPFVVAMVGLTGTSHRSIPVERSARRVGGSAYSSIARLRSGLRAIACVAAHRLMPAAVRVAARKPVVSERVQRAAG